MELNLARDVKVRKKGLCKYIGKKRKTRENVGLLLNQMEDLVAQDMEKAELLNAFLPHSLLLRTVFKNPRHWRLGESLEQGRGSDQEIRKQSGLP